MADINYGGVSGNLTRDPELRTTGSGKSVASLRIASEGFGESTNYFDLVCWDKTAEIAERFLKKGSKVTVEYRLESREWEDKTGNKRSTVECVVRNLVLPPKPAVANDDVDF